MKQYTNSNKVMEAETIKIKKKRGESEKPDE